MHDNMRTIKPGAVKNVPKLKALSICELKTVLLSGNTNVKSHAITAETVP